MHAVAGVSMRGLDAVAQLEQRLTFGLRSLLLAFSLWLLSLHQAFFVQRIVSTHSEMQCTALVVF